MSALLESQVVDIEVHLTPQSLAKDISRDCTPGFVIALIRELARLDSAVKAELEEEPL